MRMSDSPECSDFMLANCRFVSTGTIEEKIFQRQLSKEGLQSIVDDQAEVNSLSSKDLR